MHGQHTVQSMQNQATDTYGEASARCKWRKDPTYATFFGTLQESLAAERPSEGEERASMAPRKTLKMSHMKNREPMRRSSALSELHFRSSCATLCPHQASSSSKVRARHASALATASWKHLENSSTARYALICMCLYTHRALTNCPPTAACISAHATHSMLFKDRRYQGRTVCIGGGKRAVVHSRQCHARRCALCNVMQPCELSFEYARRSSTHAQTPSAHSAESDYLFD